MNKTALTIIMAAMFALSPLMAFAADSSLEGSIQGFTCVTQGTTCPVGKEDPMAAVERVFVLLTGDNDYYFIPNVDRAVLARHINERIKITGELNPKYKSIQAERIESMKNGHWEKTWAPFDEEELLKNFSL